METGVHFCRILATNSGFEEGLAALDGAVATQVDRHEIDHVGD